MKLIYIIFQLSVIFGTALAQIVSTASSFASVSSGGSLIGQKKINLQSYFDLIPTFGTFTIPSKAITSSFGTPAATTTQGHFEEIVLVPSSTNQEESTIFVSDSSMSVCAELSESSDLPRYSLSQSDFESGTKIIDNAGIYTLSGDIVFNPNSAASLDVDYYSAGDVQPQQYSVYNPKAFGIGFFAAIVVIADDVVIDLNGYSIVQAEEHALHQRFYTHIELASTPFIKGQGPHDFGNIKSGNNVCIKNGVLGRSSHGGLHGNNNKNIEVRDLTVKDYETTGIQFNKGVNILIENIELPNARQDVPVAGRFSAARFIRPWINKLVTAGYSGTLKVGNTLLTASDIQQELRDAINTASSQVLSEGGISGEFEYLFRNPGGLPDGSAVYGVIINQEGAAVNGLPEEVRSADRSKNVIIQNVTIDEIQMIVREIPALSADGTTPAADAVGAVLTTEDGVTVQQGIYKGNPITNAQLLVAKALHENFNFGFGNKNTIPPEVVSWAESGASHSSQGLQFICNGDPMFHVLKGPIAFAFGGCDQLTCEQCSVKRIENFAKIGSQLCNDNLRYRASIGVSNPKATQTGYNGGDARAFSLSSSSNVWLRDCSAGSVLANAGDAYGVDVQFGCSNVQIQDFECEVVSGGSGYSLQDYVGNPTSSPRSEKIRSDISNKRVEIQ